MGKRAPVAIDLFAGGGGLTVGLKKAGFNVIAAVELEKHAYATYKANHPDVSAFQQDIRLVLGKELLRSKKVRRVDLLAGCPPCQGFTSLTSKYRRNDQRNELIKEMGRLVEELRPRAVMLENVPGLANKGNILYEEFKATLRALEYEITEDVLQMADFGVPQLRRRLVLLAGKKFEIPLPDPMYSKNGSEGLDKWRTVEDTIRNMDDPITLRVRTH